MTASNPTPDDLIVIAKNLNSEGQSSRAIAIGNAAVKMASLEREVAICKMILAEIAARSVSEISRIEEKQEEEWK